jgi:acetylornithine/succinyldiaminopimelate/putrescine aminotransferase
MFTCEHYDVVRTCWSLAKGWAGNFPLAALIAREDLNRVMADKALGHYT